MAKPVARAGELKRDATRRHLLERALALFQERGVDATTMRDVATAAGMSLGAAYYHFDSKEALVFAYYEANQAEMEAVAATLTGPLRARLAALFHGKLASIRPHRRMLAAVVQRLVDPGDPVGAFSTQTRAVRDRAIALFEQALAPDVPADARRLVAQALWLVQMALMLVYVHDTSPDERRTHGLVDDALDLLVPLLPVLATPMGRAVLARVSAALTRAGLVATPG